MTCEAHIYATNQSAYIIYVLRKRVCHINDTPSFLFLKWHFMIVKRHFTVSKVPLYDCQRGTLQSTSHLAPEQEPPYA